MATANEMTRMVCGKCGVEHWIVSDYLDDKRETGETWSCPNGHLRRFAETNSQKLQKELDTAKKDLAAKNSKLEDIKTGKCPWCWRTVKNLNSHIARRHK